MPTPNAPDRHLRAGDNLWHSVDGSDGNSSKPLRFTRLRCAPKHFPLGVISWCVGNVTSSFNAVQLDTAQTTWQDEF
eukprot:m.347351 g.347351  ORF g.347351 m.347351 type:complete len:77 (+) comp19865_c1_seq6:169-399(+)